MSWRDDLLDGSFRGVSFFYETVTGEFGRKTILKEYPGRDTPFVEDQGLATRRFTIDMFVIGPDYFSDRDDLRIALEQAGSGTLIHPYWGVMTVTLEGKATCTETTKQGGMAKFTATFIEAGEELREIVNFDTLGNLISLAEALMAAAQGIFAEIFSVINAISNVIEEAVGAVEAVADSIRLIQKKIEAALQLVTDVGEVIGDLVSALPSLILLPKEFATAFTGMVEDVVSSIEDLGAAFTAAVELYGSEDALPAEGNVLAARTQIDVLSSTIQALAVVPSVIPIQPSGVAQQQSIAQANQQEITRLTRIAIIGAVSKTAAGLSYESRDQAQAMSTAVLGLIDTLLTDDGLRDELYGPTVNLREALYTHFNQVANTLPELTQYVPAVSTPAVVLAYRLYADSNREAEILARNQEVRDPTAVPGGKVIEVLL